MARLLNRIRTRSASGGGGPEGGMALVLSMSVALVVFALTKLFFEQPAAAPSTKSCPECLEAIPISARKCRACASAVK